jgi:hypothetical protein
MKTKKIAFLCLLIICNSFVKAQISSDQQRILKYWYYREKLKTKFIVGIGSGRGESMPTTRPRLQRGCQKFAFVTQ